jgi:hypothetical protein
LGVLLQTWNESVNFTREPLIETIISPKDGFKLLVRSSKAGAGEEYIVDAVEVVSFGKAFFFRSLERPKSFLVPASDYEVLEVKETRVALKNVSHERTIKIGGGREGPVRQREQQPSRDEESSVEESLSEGEPTPAEPRSERRRDRRRHRRRRQSEEQDWSRGHEQQQREVEQKSAPFTEGSEGQEEVKTSTPLFGNLIPPPPTLISETLGRLKNKEASEGLSPEPSQEEPLNKQQEDSESDSSPLNRVHAVEESSTFTSTYFSPLPDKNNFNPFF